MAPAGASCVLSPVSAEGFAVAEPQPLHARAARSNEALPAVR